MTEARPFAYLEGMTPEADAPVMTDGKCLYCPTCVAKGESQCDEPGLCGNLRPMRPRPEDEPIVLPKVAHKPRSGSAEYKDKPRPSLDDSIGRIPIEPVAERIRRHVPSGVRGELFPERLMGRKTTFTKLPDEEQSYEWFMENINDTVEQFK